MDSGFAAVDDLATLSRLDNDILVEQLRERYNNDKIYTYVGDILVAINPYRPLPLYTPKIQSVYHMVSKGEQPPHVFALADTMLQYMNSKNKSQCCIVSGESGAGKTESAKYIIRQITELSKSSVSSAQGLENSILQVNPLLEAFGNAQTNMNHNSSRFGKYTELVFSSAANASNEIVGARISEYLLEKSRVVDQAPGERTFHMLYYVFANPEREKYQLSHQIRFPYFSDDIETVADPKQHPSFEMFAEVVTALRDVGFSATENDTIMAILAAVLHLGRIEFVSADEFSAASIDPTSKPAIETVATLISISAEELGAALVQNENFTAGERVVREYTRQQALDTSDAMAKALYSRLFSWLVSNINLLLCPPSENKSAAEHMTLGILDIYGFECFDTNSFEQICINLANEYLQHFFNKHVFELELAEYAREGIEKIDVAYEDNLPLLNLFFKPSGILGILDEECTFPNASGTTLVSKYEKQFGGDKYFVATKEDGTTFQIIHYAGKVEYDSEFFLDKNRDLLAPAVVEVLQNSQVSMVAELFVAEITETGKIVSPLKRADSVSTRGRKIAGAKSKLNQNTYHKKSVSVGHQYKTSLQLLIDGMSKCTPHFVRCIKPNDEQRPRDFNNEKVLIQLKYTGMLETTRIRREGYAVRPSFTEFVDRFRSLTFGFRENVEPTASTCVKILTSTKIEGWHVGKSKMFLRYPQLEELEERLHLFRVMAIVIQRYFRGFLARKITKPLLQQAREQKAQAKSMFDKFKQRSTAGAKLLTELTQEDVTRLNERREKMIAESKQLTSRRRDDRRKRAEEELKNIQVERENIIGDAGIEYEKERLRLVALLKKEQAANNTTNTNTATTNNNTTNNDNNTNNNDNSAKVFRDLVSLISERQHMLSHKSETCQGVTHPLRLELNKSNVALDEANNKRDDAVRALIGSTPRTPTFDENRVKWEVSLTHVDGQMADVERLRTSVELNEQLEREIEKELKIVDGHLKTTHTDRVTYLTTGVERRDSTILGLNDQLVDLRRSLEQDIAETKRSASSMQAMVEHSNAEVERLSTALEAQMQLHDKAKQEHRTAIDTLTVSVADTSGLLQGQLDVANKTISELQSKVRQSSISTSSLEEEHAAVVSKLKSELRQVQRDLGTLTAEKDAVTQELSTKVDSGQAAESSQLRVKLKAALANEEEMKMQLTRQQQEAKSQGTVIDVARAEFASMVEDLKRTMLQNETTAATILKDKETETEHVSKRFKSLHEESEKELDGKEATISQLQMDLNQQRLAHLAALEGKQVEVIRVDREKEELIAAAQSANAALTATKVQLMEVQVELSVSIEKLERNIAEADLRDTESIRTVASLKSLITEQDGSFETIQAEHEQIVFGLREELRSFEEKAEALSNQYEVQIDELSQNLNQKTDMLSEESIENVASAQRLREEVQQLRADNDELITANENSAEENTLLREQLQQLTDDLESSVHEPTESSGPEPPSPHTQVQLNHIANHTASQGELNKLVRSIRSMGRQSPGNVTPGDSSNVDLMSYVNLCFPGKILPDGIQLGRFTCKGFISKQAGKHWHKRWMVFDLRKKVITWFVDERELHIGQKGSNAIVDVLSVVRTAAGEANIQTKRKPVMLKSEDQQITSIWIQIFSAIARNNKPPQSESTA